MGTTSRPVAPTSIEELRGEKRQTKTQRTRHHLARFPRATLVVARATAVAVLVVDAVIKIPRGLVDLRQTVLDKLQAKKQTTDT